MATKAIYTDLDMLALSRMTNLPDAVGLQEPATYAQLLAAIEGTAWKDNVRVASQVNVTIANPGTAIFNGVTLSVGERILLPVQTAGAENGIYNFNGSAVALTRSADASTWNEIKNARIPVDEGTVNAQVIYQNTTFTGTLGTTTIVFSIPGNSAPAASETVAGIAELATQAETDAGTDDLRIVTPLKLATYSGRAKRFAQIFGDNAALTYTLTHGLGTDKFDCTVWETGGNKREVDCEKRRTATTVVLVFNSAIATNALEAVLTA